MNSGRAIRYCTVFANYVGVFSSGSSWSNNYLAV